MNSNLHLPCINEPTRIVDKQKPTLIDNTFVNLPSKELKSGNLIKKISDHLPNFINIKNINKKTSKQNIKVRDLNSFHKDTYSNHSMRNNGSFIQRPNITINSFDRYTQVFFITTTCL